MKLLFGVSFLMASTAQLHSVQYEYDYNSPGVVSPHHGILTLQASPQCWTDALLAMHHLEYAVSQDAPPSSALGTIVCAAMSHDHKKALALELARCQMEDFGQALFHPNATGCSRPIASTMLLHTCLSHMTDAGMSSYLHCFAHVHQSCIRLTQERLMQASHVATEELHAMLAYQSEMWAKQDEQERERELSDQELRKLHENMLENLWSKSNEQSSQMLEFTKNIEATAEKTQERLTQASHVATEQLRTQYENMLENLWKKSEEQNSQILELVKNVEATAEKMKPLFGIESLVAMATNGISLLSSLIHFLAMMNAVWLLTLSKRHDTTRRYMFRMACAEAFLEFAMHWMVSQGVLADVDRVRGISTLRTMTLASECGTYMVGLIRSFFQTSSKEGVAFNEVMLEHMEMMQLMNANAEKLRKEALEREQRVSEPVAPRIRQVGGYHSVGNMAQTSPGLVSLPPMYNHPRSDTTLGASFDKEQSYAMAYHEALRIVLAHTPQPYLAFPQGTVDSPPRFCEQEVVHEQSNNSMKDPRKRLHGEKDEYDEEPEKKRLKQ